MVRRRHVHSERHQTAAATPPLLHSCRHDSLGTHTSSVTLEYCSLNLILLLGSTEFLLGSVEFYWVMLCSTGFYSVRFCWESTHAGTRRQPAPEPPWLVLPPKLPAAPLDSEVDSSPPSEGGTHPINNLMICSIN